MSKNQPNRGGIHIGRAGRDVTVNAGSDVVGGDKITKTTNEVGFRTADQKMSFHEQLAHIEEALHEVKGHIDASNALDESEKARAGAEIVQHLRTLREAKQQTTSLAPGEQPPAGVVQRVEAGLAGATSFMDKVQAMVVRGGELAEKLTSVLSRLAPLVLNVRHLFGLG